MAAKKTAKKATGQVAGKKQGKQAAKSSAKANKGQGGTAGAKARQGGKGAGAKGGAQQTKPTAGGKKQAGTKRGTTGSASKGTKPAGQMSGLDAAARVLAEAEQPLSCRQIVERAFEAGYWSTAGKTPAATIYAAIGREIRNRGADSRFQKVDRGRFTRNG